MSKKESMVKRSALPIAAPTPAAPLKLDLGCGGQKKGPDWTGIDVMKFPGVDMVANLAEPMNDTEKHWNRDAPLKFKRWPWKDSSVDEARSSHFIEHLEPLERIHFVNELYRVLKPGATVEIIAPHWSSMRAYGDLTHRWPPISEFWFYYLKEDWRKTNAPHNTEYRCNFDVTWGFGIPEDVRVRNPDYQQFAMNKFKDTCQDIIATFRKI
jgi:hypothetical protein